MNPLLPDSVEQSIEGLVGAAQRSAAHLEMRDGYMRSDPSFVAWQAGTALGSGRP